MNHDAAQAAPPISVAGLALWGVPLSDWVLILTLIYTLFLLIDKAPVIWKRLMDFVDWLHGRDNDQSK